MVWGLGFRGLQGVPGVLERFKGLYRVVTGFMGFMLL